MDETELEELRGSALLDFTERRINTAKYSYGELPDEITDHVTYKGGVLWVMGCRQQQIPTLLSPHSTADKPCFDECDVDFLWGLSVMWSRSFTVPVKDQEGTWHQAPCMVPVADMFNTGESPLLQCVYRPGSDGVCVCVCCAYICARA